MRHEEEYLCGKMRARRIILVFSFTTVAFIVLRKLGVSYSSLLLNISFFSLAFVVLTNNSIFRTILARLVLSISVIAALALLQYWLESYYIIIPSLIAFFIFMILAFKFIVHKPSGLLVFLPVFTIFLLFLILNPRQFHNLFRPTSYEDFVMLKHRQEQGLMTDMLINRYKKIDLQKADDLFSKAVLEDSLKNTEKALELYSKSIENNPDNPFAFHRRGFLKLTRLELNPANAVSALKDFSKAIRLDSMFAEAYFHRSMSYYYLGYKNRAYRDQLNVLKLDSMIPDSEFEVKYGRSKKSLSIPPDS